MARPVWSGSISFGLVNLGVGLFSATERKDVSFHQFERGTNKRVRQKRVAEDTDREVEWDDIAKGYETDSGEHVIVTPEELDDVAPEASRVIHIDDFVELADIDPIFYERTYYLGPRGEPDAYAYRLLFQAMRRAGLAGIGGLVMRNKEYLALIRAADDVLVLNTMRFADEVRDPIDVVGDLMLDHEVRDRELETAVYLIRELSTEWDPTRYRDTYRERVLDLINQKVKGEKVEVPAPEEPKAEVVDLVSALERSIEEARRDGGRGRGQRGRQSRREGRQAGNELTRLSKRELYDRASEIGIAGRSKMSKTELQEALAEAS